MGRKIYLNKMSLKAAQDKFFAVFSARVMPGEEIRINHARGRITAQSVFAQRSAPHYAASAMDGIAVQADDTALASERNPVELIAGKTAFWVDTGEPLPENCDSVIKIEEVYQKAGQLVIEKAVAPWQHVRSIGESVIRGQLVLPINHQITSYDLGGLLEAGVTKVLARKKPQVAIIPTGTELVPADNDPRKGQLIEFNSAILQGYLEEWGADAQITEIVNDQEELIRAQIISAVADNDIIVVIAGSSAGKEDFTLKILQEIGTVFVHGVNIMPGKPVILAEVNGKPVIGLPGYPLAATLDNYLFIRPLVYSLLGLAVPKTPSIEGVIKRKIPSHVGLAEFLRVNLAEIDGQIVAVPRKKGSAAMESLLKADGVLVIPEQKEGLAGGSKCPVFLLKPQSEIRNNLLLIGSHDLTLDLLTDLLRRNKTGFDLITQSVGSLAGLMALKRQEAHLAGAHLLDETTGEYNLAHVRRVLPGRQIALINLVYRQQGLMIKRGNPKNIQGITDLVRNDIHYINRQRGAGTRILFDYWLKKSGILPSEITGYQREEYTHIAAAVAVFSGFADTALGIKAAAEAMDLDFLPLVEERYDLVISSDLLHDWRINCLLEIINSTDFKTQVEALGGYRLDNSGEIKYIDRGGKEE